MDGLSSREQQVAQLVLEGKSNKQIAALLHISLSTVEFHLKNIYARLQVSSRVELILKLRESTVAGAAQPAENRDGQSSSDWSTLWKQAVAKFGKEMRRMNVVNETNPGQTAAMTFLEAVRVCLAKYAQFEGRAGRAEFWWFALFVTLLVSAFQYVSDAAAAVAMISVLLPFLAVGARRLRDAGKNPWWMFFLLVPVGGIIMLGIYWAQPSAPPPDAG